MIRVMQPEYHLNNFVKIKDEDSIIIDHKSRIVVLHWNIILETWLVWPFN